MSLCLTSLGLSVIAVDPNKAETPLRNIIHFKSLIIILPPKKRSTDPGAVVGSRLQLRHLGDLLQEVRLLHAGLGAPALEQRLRVLQDHLEVHGEACG